MFEMWKLKRYEKEIEKNNIKREKRKKKIEEKNAKYRAKCEARNQRDEKILAHFMKAMDKLEQILSDYGYSEGAITEETISRELTKALEMFDFNSIEEVTEEQLKKRRNNLMRTYHPDEGEGDVDIAQRINLAYDLLKANL